MGENEKPITAAYVLGVNEDGTPKCTQLPNATVSSMDTLEYHHDSQKLSVGEPCIKLACDGIFIKVKIAPQDLEFWRWILSGSESRVLPARLRRMHAAKLQRNRKQEKRRKKEAHYERVSD